MRKLARSTVLFLWIPMVLLVLSGCGSGYKAGSDSAATAHFGSDPKTGVQYVGASTCISCHKTINIQDTGISNDVVNDYLQGEHAIHSTHNNAASTTPVTLPSGETGTCLTCHDPIGAPDDPDGTTIQSLIPAADVPSEGLAAVTCEACHGAGGQHFGTGPIPNPTPDWTACGNTSVGSCHAGPVADHITYHPENFPVASPDMPRPANLTIVPAGRTSIEVAYENAANSHKNSIKSPNYVSGSTTDVKGLCSRCHTDEGARLYKYANGDSGQLDAQFPNDGVANPVVDASPVQCRTCHDPHNNIGGTSGAAADASAGTGTLYGNAGLLLNATTVSGQKWSGQFATCNNCHQLENPNDGKWLVGGNDSSGNPEVGHHDIAASQYGRVGVFGGEGTYDWFQTPAYTHYDDPATKTVEGYIINTTDVHSNKAGNNNGGACLDCHNPHNPDLTINNQWAESPHAGFILQAKLNAYNAAKAAGDTGPEISSAVHSAGVTEGAFTDGQQTKTSCHRCHTSTGFRDLANNPAGYDPAKDVATATGQEGELIYCWACHTTDVGDLRNPGQFSTATMTDSNGHTTYVIPSGSSFPAKGDTNYPGGSYICINCHSGRETGQYVQQNYNIATIQGIAVGYAGGAPDVDSHHAQDAGIMYRTVGYQFPGANYSNGHFKHDTIGTPAGAASSAGFDDNGPCVSCHMRTGATDLPSHIFNATSFSGTVTFPATTNGKAVTVGLVSGIITDDVCLTCHGTGNYEMTATKLNTIESGYQAALSALQQQLYNDYGKLSITAWNSMGDVGAAFNMKTLQAMPWAFPHNDVYVKRLIFDSLDWLEHEKLTGTINVNAIPGLSAAWPNPANVATTQAQWVADYFANNGEKPGTANPAAVTRP
ncbi:MAG: multiheme c-type cytochrome [Nitrospiraceae bacterium]|nr:multiheme c-type cytochrome [Nitrospiraceae bacterium]